MEFVTEALNTHGAMTAQQIVGCVYRKHNVRLTPAKIAGMMRPLVMKGLAGSSKNEHNKTVYWMNSKRW